MDEAIYIYRYIEGIDLEFLADVITSFFFVRGFDECNWHVDSQSFSSGNSLILIETMERKRHVCSLIMLRSVIVKSVTYETLKYKLTILARLIKIV